MSPLAPAPKLRVLVAEDERLAALVVEDALVEQGHQVVLARDGQEAIDIAQTYAFDVLVTDLAMPRVTGWELIPLLRARWAALPVVVMTGYPPNGGTRALHDGTAPLELLTKPVELSRLVSAIRQVAGQA